MNNILLCVISSFLIYCFSNYRIATPLNFIILPDSQVSEVVVISRVDGRSMSETEVVRVLSKHKKSNTPVHIIGGISSWNAIDRWELSYLKKHVGHELVNLVASIPEQEVPMWISTRMRDFISWLEEHPSVESSIKFTNDTGLRPFHMSEIIDFVYRSKVLMDDVENLEMFTSSDLSMWSYFDLFDIETAFWMSPAGGRTGLHYDPDPFNVLCHLRGVKNFTLIHPSQTKNMYPSYLLWDSGAVVSDVNMWSWEASKFPLFEEALKHSTNILLNPGKQLLSAAVVSFT
eukprot:TRINITY_DN3949_c0_g1_i2.p1 TRINITY_DN3949_c0_g1~~TRINITY_DN3949_c0_g1_i2.p1  ORF type:complete len:288 (-),score=28.78 TRINITY_DN3949_c0_g1_i2:234-1097(-)